MEASKKLLIETLVKDCADLACVCYELLEETEDFPPYEEMAPKVNQAYEKMRESRLAVKKMLEAE